MTLNEILPRREPANFIANTWQPSAGPPLPSHNPADPNDALPPSPDSTHADVDAAVTAAAAAAPGWAKTPAPVRGDILYRFNELLGEHADDLAALMTREMGKPLAESAGEIGRSRMELDYAAGESTRLHGQTIPSRQAGQLVYTEPVPLGVVGAITPWNFPTVAPIRKLGPALVTGNAVVLKPAAQTPLTALVLADLLHEAGLPEGVCNVVCGRGASAGAALAKHRRVNGVSFTGSTAVGRSIAQTMAGRLGTVQLELGGKNAAYIHSAADLDKAISQIVAAATQTAGQRCTAISRVIVEEELADQVVDKLGSIYSNLSVGPGTMAGCQVGPLVSQTQYERVAGYVRAGLDEGATRVTAERDLPAGPYFSPTVLDGVTPDMTVAREEIFGPVLSVLRVSGPDEAIKIVNDCDYGLAGVVFSESLDVAMRFSREVDAGMIHVNHGTISQSHVPFGGVKDSGVGAFSIGYTSTDFFTQTKTVYLSPDVP